MSRNECVEVVLGELERYGIPGEVRPRSKHIEIGWTYNGQHRYVIVASTPSDRRALLNTRAEVRRLLRADNVQLPVEPVVSLQKALSLPSPQDHGPVRLAKLEREFEVLLGMTADLQEEVRGLRTKRENIRVTAVVSFEAPVAAEAAPPAPVVAAPLILGKRTEGRSTAIMAVLKDGAWHDVKEIVQATGIPAERISRCLNYLKADKGLIENGQRGLWRKKPAVSAVAQGG